MSLDTSPRPLSAIENEIPAYRAVSRPAVASLLLGVAGVLAFADLWFLLFSLAAIVAGVVALRRINRFPDMLTGAGLARIGIALGLVFSLSAATFTGVRQFQVQSSADRFARGLTKVLASRNVANIAYYRNTEAQRKDKTPAEVYQEMNQGADEMTRMMYIGPVENIVGQYNSGKGGEVHYLGLEKSGYQGVQPYAFALYEFHAKDAAGKPNETLALIELKSPADTPGFSWYISEIIYPYERLSHKLAEKPVDDGHGHGH